MAYNGQDGPEPSCTWWYWKEGNCRISECWTVTNQYSNDNNGPERLEVTGDNIGRAYDSIKGKCQKMKAGGRSSASKSADGKVWVYTEVTNDPEQSPPSRIRRHLGPTADRVVKETVSLEEYEEWRKGLEERQKRAAGVDTAIMSKRSDDDNEYYINNSGTNVRKDDEYDVGPRASNGVTTEYSTSNSKSWTTTVSANIGGAFKMFTAGIGFEHSETTEFTITKGMKFTPKCEGNQKGQAKFYPYFNYYDVTFYPSATRVDIWIPVEDSDKFIKGDIEIECLG